MDITYPLLIPGNYCAVTSRGEGGSGQEPEADRVRIFGFSRRGGSRGVSPGRGSLGYRVRTVQRWWQVLSRRRLWQGLLAPPQRRGPSERITSEAWESLQAEMRAGHIGGLHEAQAYLRDTWHMASSPLTNRARVESMHVGVVQIET